MRQAPWHTRKMKSILAALLMAAIGCGVTGPETLGDDAEPDGGDGDASGDGDAPGGEDGGVSLDGGASNDSGDGLPEWASCNVLADECASGLTCRLVDFQGAGRCHQVGDVPAGGFCDDPFTTMAISDCGAAMACYNQPDGECIVICDMQNPMVRCAVDETCSGPLISDTNIGLCN